MSVIVRDDGFHADDWAGPVLEIDADAAPEVLDAAAKSGALVRVGFAAFGDGRGFTLARRLRALGFAGRLRAAGPLLADQYAMARRSGFDEIEIPDAIAARQPEPQWIARANWRENDYQRRLRG
ncbi:MAG: DUF934 domain-containing protein [Rhodobacteraceae bacterium]|nr:DUF934 domain-containing protein [Paracoccaceae bacterium]